VSEVKNAKIAGTSLSSADHGMLSSFIRLDYGGSEQGFGGYCLYNQNFVSEPSFAGHWIWRVMEVVGVDEWSDLKGNTVRAKIEKGMVVAIGHIIEDRWFTPHEEIDMIKNGE
jgi:hypothetical protein